MYEKKIAFGDKGCPFNQPYYSGDIDYSRGICPETERAHFETLITHELMLPPMSNQDLDDVVRAFEKVTGGIPALCKYEARKGGA